MSPKIVHCALKKPLYTSPVSYFCTIDNLNDYVNVKDNVRALLTYYFYNKAYYGDIEHIDETTYHKSLCINQMLYYTRPPVY